ncbi:MAG: YMGG-like glycine zipper-containing protein [Hyphomonadaceae bacterium]|nr:YMGG-like glycine zipper-containing protein [Hyphomonadaceae bacterium]
MTRLLTITAVSAAALMATACTSTGTMERRAATGAAIGAVAGAVIGNNSGSGDADDGAVVGAIIGGAAGAAQGCYAALDCDVPGVDDPYDPYYAERNQGYNRSY